MIFIQSEPIYMIIGWGFFVSLCFSSCQGFPSQALTIHGTEGEGRAPS